VSHFRDRKGWLVSGQNRADLYHKELASSRLCLAPAGWELWSVRLYEALLLGCVPVIMSDGLELPFQSRIDYSKMTVRWELDLRRIKPQRVLASIGRGRDALWSGQGT